MAAPTTTSAAVDTARAPPWPAVVAVLHGRVRSRADRAAHRHRRAPRQTRHVAAVVAEYFDSQQFFASKSAGTQRMRRGILERFRAAYGERPFALLPPEWIEALLDAKPPHAARSWLVTLRSLCQFAVKRGWLRADPTRDIKQRAIKGDGFHCELGVSYTYPSGAAEAGPIDPEDWPAIQALEREGKLSFTSKKIHQRFLKLRAARSR